MSTRSLASLVAALAVSVFAAFAGLARASVVEQHFEVPVQVVNTDGRRIEQNIVVTVFDDDSIAGPKPVIVINHGRPGEAAQRAAMGRVRFPEVSRWFAQEGFLVAVPTRIGYGASGGEDVESSGACAHRDYRPVFIAAATESLAALSAVRARPDALHDRSVVLGQSYGGATTLAVASMNPPGVVASINFAGGGGGDPYRHPRSPCSPQLFKRMVVQFGETARVPMLWAYTENDQYWGPALPREWFDAFVGAGGRAEFVQFPPHGVDGHQLFARFFGVWRPTVADFLRRQGFEMKDMP